MWVKTIEKIEWEYKGGLTMLQEHQLISKILDEKNFFITKKYNLTVEDFVELPKVYKFVEQYVRENKGAIPDYRTVQAEFEDFEYMPEVQDTFQYLCKSLKSNTAKRQAFELLQKQAGEQFKKLKGADFIEWLKNETQRIYDVTNAQSSMGTNYATNGLERKEWYNDTKTKRTNILVPTPYPTLTKLMGGGNELGDYMLLMAYTNRGKSWIGSHFGLAAWEAKFGVLHYSPELTKKQQMDRLDTLKGHFNNSDLKRGELVNEHQYIKYLEENFSDNDEATPYIIKTMEDLDFGLTLDVIEADLSNNPELKVCIIDGFNLMSHSGKDSTSRNNMANTSRRLRQIFGKYGVLGIVIHQTPTAAEKENRTTDELGKRMVKAPRIDQYSETVAVIQDACTVLTFDQSDGNGVLAVRKARLPIVDSEVNLYCDFNLGYINEISQAQTFNF